MNISPGQAAAGPQLAVNELTSGRLMDGQAVEVALDRDPAVNKIFTL